MRHGADIAAQNADRLLPAADLRADAALLLIADILLLSRP
jgi:hypothetical protein